MQLGKIILRVVQFALMAIVMGLSIALFKGQHRGHVPSITTWSIVCGVFGAFVAVVGLVSIWIERPRALPMLILDGLASLFFISGGIAMAVQLGVGACDGKRPTGWPDNNDWGDPTPNPYCATHGIISGGAAVFHPWQEQDWTFYLSNSWYVSRCRMAQADVAFLFFSIAAFAAALALSFLAWRRAGGKLTAH